MIRMGNVASPVNISDLNKGWGHNTYRQRRDESQYVWSTTRVQVNRSIRTIWDPLLITRTAPRKGCLHGINEPNKLSPGNCLKTV